MQRRVYAEQGCSREEASTRNVPPAYENEPPSPNTVAYLLTPKFAVISLQHSTEILSGPDFDALLQLSDPCDLRPEDDTSSRFAGFVDEAIRLEKSRPGPSNIVAYSWLAVLARFVRAGISK